MVLYAPADSFVVKVLAEPGDVLIPGDPVMVLAAACPRQVVAYLDEDRGWQVAKDEKVILRRRGIDGSAVEGTVADVAEPVSQIPSRLWPTPTRPRWGRQVFIRPDPNHELSPGELLDITFLPPREMSGFAVHAADLEEPAAVPGKDLSPLLLPSGLRSKSRFEPSGIVWLEALRQYVTVSDDTGWETAGDNYVDTRDQWDGVADFRVEHKRQFSR